MTALFHVRHAEKSDAGAIAELMIGLGYSPDAAEILRRWKMVESTTFDKVLIAEGGKTPLGLLALHVAPLLFYPNPMARITTLVVAEAARRSGVGSALVERAMSIASNEGCETIELTSACDRKDAHTFYETVGFQKSSIRMSRKVPQDL